jgi:hypothetical protein
MKRMVARSQFSRIARMMVMIFAASNERSGGLTVKSPGTILTSDRRRFMFVSLCNSFLLMDSAVSFT